MKVIGFIKDYAVADRIIYHLKLTFLRRKNSRRSGRGAA
jgi:hypothetical protein